jgi:hypothetical protein
MKKKFLISVLAAVMVLFLYPLITKGQNNYEDVIYLKNGGATRGMIIEQVPNVSFKIQTVDRNVFVYKIEEIEKITKEPVRSGQGNVRTNVETNPPTNVQNNPPNNVRNNPPNNTQDSVKKEARVKTSKPVIDHIKQKGLTCLIELNMNRYDFQEKDFSLSTGIRASVGYLVNPHFSAGAGTGFTVLNDECYIPFFGALRFNFGKQNVTPYVSADFGYTCRVSNTYNHDRGGLMLDPAFGVKFFVSTNVALTFSLGYLYQECKYQYYLLDDGYNYPIENKSAYKMFNFNFGVTI